MVKLIIIKELMTYIPQNYSYPIQYYDVSNTTPWQNMKISSICNNPEPGSWAEAFGNWTVGQLMCESDPCTGGEEYRIKVLEQAASRKAPWRGYRY